MKTEYTNAEKVSDRFLKTKYAELREKLATNTLAFIQDLEIDGVDVDWEVPSSIRSIAFRWRRRRHSMVLYCVIWSEN